MGFADPVEAVVLYQLDNPAETGFHVGRQDIELFANSVVQQFYDPRHLRVLSHFCNGDGSGHRIVSNRDGARESDFTVSHPALAQPSLHQRDGLLQDAVIAADGESLQGCLGLDVILIVGKPQVVGAG